MMNVISKQQHSVLQNCGIKLTLTYLYNLTVLFKKSLIKKQTVKINRTFCAQPLSHVYKQEISLNNI